MLHSKRTASYRLKEKNIATGEGSDTCPGVPDPGDGRYRSFEIAGVPIFLKSSGNKTR